jgi:isopenicillin N synthase-like dioxygenase
MSQEEAVGVLEPLVVDLSPFLSEGDEDRGGAKRAAADAMREACQSYGIALVTGHGLDCGEASPALRS